LLKIKIWKHEETNISKWYFSVEWT
jgi:hypothetical protein